MTQLIVSPAEFGIEEKKANELLSNLPQILEERSVLESQYNDIIKMDIEDSETHKKARSLRLLIKDNRTKGIAQWHKLAKDYFLKGGQFVDAIKRKEIEVNERMEANLEEIEKYAEIQEAKRREELREFRSTQLEPYSEFVPVGIDLSSMSEEDFEKLLNGSKLQLEAKIEAEKKAEQERIEKERLLQIHNERREALIPYWNLIPAEKRDIDLSTLSDEDWQKTVNWCKSEQKKKEEEQKRIIAENKRLEQERAKAEAEAKRVADERAAEAAKQAKILQAEREAREKLEREAKAKAEAEAKAKAKEEAKRKAAEAAPDKEKLKALAAQFDSFVLPVVVTAEAKQVIADVQIMLGKLSTHINSKL